MRRLLFTVLFVLVAISGWAQSPVTTPDYVSKFFDVTGTPTNSLIFDNGTYVGIGTTTPLYNLHVTSLVDPAAIVVEGIGAVGANFIGLRAEGAAGGLTHVNANDNLFTLQGRGYGSSGWSSGSRAYLKMFANESWTDTAQSTYITFGTVPAGSKNIAERLRIDNAGRVGINTTTPGALLEVNGSALIDGPITVAGQIQSTSGGFKFPDGTSLTTAGLVVNSPLTGSGTASNPLGLNLSVNPPLSGGNNGVPLALSGTVGPLNGGTGLNYVGTGILRGNGMSLGYGSIQPSDLPTGVYVDLVSPQTIGGNKVFSNQASFNVGTGGTNAVMAEADATGSFAVQGTTNATDTQAAGVVGNAMNNGTSSARGVLGMASGNSGTGVVGTASGSNGVGVAGSASGSGNPVGVSGFVNSSGGAGGVFQNNAQGGDILRATYNGSMIFKIGTNSSGRPFANLAPLGQPGTGSGGGVGSGMMNFSAAVLDNTTNCSGSPCVQNPKLGWRADPINNNAAGFSAQLALYSGVGSSNSNPTGLSIASNGIITFAPGQTFSAGAGLTGVTAGTGLTGGGTSGNVTLSVDPTKVQPLLTGLTAGASCGTGSNQVVQSISSTGAVTCISLTAGNGGVAYLPLSGTAQVSGPVSVVPPTSGASSIYAVNAVQNQQGATMPNGGGGPTAAWFTTVPAAIVGTATDNSGNVAAGILAQGTGQGDLALAATSVGVIPTIFAWNQNTSTPSGGNGPDPQAIDAQTSASFGEVIYAEATAAAGTSPTCNNCDDLTVFAAEADATSGVTNLFYGEAGSPYSNGIQLQFDQTLATSCPQGSQCPSVFDAQGQNGNFNIDGAFNVSTTGNISADNGSISANSASFNSLSVNGFNDLTVNGSANFNNGLSVNNGSATFSDGLSTTSISGTGSTCAPNNGLCTLTVNTGNLNVTGGETVNGGLTAGWATFSGLVQANGGLNVTGSFNAPNKSFKIDDPIDPANKYLYHSSIESSEMMNLYSGTVALDKRGGAWVQLPDWFEALNKDFRYQLTAIGAPGPNLYIAKEISGNRFRIAGGKAGMKVSWQVTGVRHDEWANAHRVQVEVEKAGKERGTYLYPELFPEKTALAQKK